jgi:hypothetical protein
MKTKDILENEDFLSKSLNIGVTVDAIMSEFNVFDWMELSAQPEAIYNDFKERVCFKNPIGKFKSIREKAFLHKFDKSVLNISALIEEVHSSYNIPSGKGVSNQNINQYYYLKYWADKKNIPVNYNDQDFNNRKLFNFYTILFDIFADKLSNFNEYNRQKAKK